MSEQAPRKQATRPVCSLILLIIVALHVDRAGSLCNLYNWYAEPILCFKTITEPTTSSDNIIVMLNFKTGYDAKSHLLMVCLYEETLKLNHNENGMIEHLLIKN